jgi:pyruvate formate lyase activating enzyme
VHVDPIEKKPLYHFLPGAPILSIATAGCNLSCLNCQNWEISQSPPEETRNHDLPPERLVAETAERGIPAIAYTYSEPIVFYEYVRDTAVLARERDIRNVLVTAGYISEEPLRELCRVVDAANVDFKSFSERFYKRISGAKLEPVQRSLEVMMEEGVWLEVTRLMIPTHSDDPEDVRAMCDWLVRVLGPDVPLHLSRFHPAYQLQGLPPTSVEALGRAYDVARESGMRHVYVGNVPGHEAQHTLCPSCGKTVITRRGYSTPRVSLEEGRCACGEPIAGIWT